ncbi:hypothetical protein QZH41_004981 [Actinostola sp. cb2023]|nr:hypothetical protein QZH41_004981 [Actinostola sp. cb2023]
MRFTTDGGLFRGLHMKRAYEGAYQYGSRAAYNGVKFDIILLFSVTNVIRKFGSKFVWVALTISGRPKQNVFNPDKFTQRHNLPIPKDPPPYLQRFSSGICEREKGLLHSKVSKAEYFAITRIPQSDSGFNQGSSKSLDPNNVNKVNDEFIRVVTTAQDGGEHTEFHATVVPKPDVVARSRSNTGLPVNVMMIGIDSTSNARFQRALPEAYKYLTDDLKSIVMKGYTIVGDGTTPALTALLTGNFEYELPEARRGFAMSQTIDNWPWIFKDYKKSGYATMYSEDGPTVATFNLRLHGFKNPPTDHFSRYFWQAAAVTNPLCIHGKPQHVIHLDYFETFFEAYSKTPKLGFGYLSDISHNDQNTLYLLDGDLTKFLKNFQQRLNDTILIVLSDHGVRYGATRVMMQGHLEERLPFLSFTFPSWFESQHPEIVKNLRHNVDSVTSPFDLHLTLHHILSYPDVPKPHKGSRGSSLFAKIPRSRDFALDQLHTRLSDILVHNAVDERVYEGGHQ